MRNNEPLHPLQQCLRDNGEQIAEKVTELQFKEVLAVNAELRAILIQPAHEVEASVPTFPCESCGAFHSYSEVSEAGGYCPQCEADYDERKMFADLLERYTALAAAPRPVAQDGWMSINTAPNGDIILLGYEPHPGLEGSRRVHEGRWNEDQQTWTSVNGFLVFSEATHWMPLPAAPKGGE